MKIYGLGTIINVAAIVIGGLLGMLFGRFIRDRHRDTLCKACGLSVIFIGVAGALKGMFSVVDGKIVYGGDFLIIGSLALGALIGEIINIEGGFEKFGSWLKKRPTVQKITISLKALSAPRLPCASVPWRSLVQSMTGCTATLPFLLQSQFSTLSSSWSWQPPSVKEPYFQPFPWLSCKAASPHFLCSFSRL